MEIVTHKASWDRFKSMRLKSKSNFFRLSGCFLSSRPTSLVFPALLLIRLLLVIRGLILFTRFSGSLSRVTPRADHFLFLKNSQQRFLRYRISPRVMGACSKSIVVSSCRCSSILGYPSFITRALPPVMTRRLPLFVVRSPPLVTRRMSTVGSVPNLLREPAFRVTLRPHGHRSSVI